MYQSLAKTPFPSMECQVDFRNQFYFFSGLLVYQCWPSYKTIDKAVGMG